ncbi:peptidase inhibitor family I36 protein [Streptomyces sp. NPDC059909]|uniref:peptidase inhibitor family I36 protein n=1 Tax=Streptomyces sp. NPDC059909 TaxID=3346998 RepID=UPI00365237C6
MNLRRSLVRLGVGAVALTGLLAGTATSASAIPRIDINSGAGSCPANWVCLWNDPNFVARDEGAYTGPEGVGDYEPIPDMGKLKFEGQLGGWQGMQDEATSVVNNTWNNVCFYEHNWYSGLEFRIQGKEQWAYVPWWIDNKISSWKWC